MTGIKTLQTNVEREKGIDLPAMGFFRAGGRGVKARSGSSSW